MLGLLIEVRWNQKRYMGKNKETEVKSMRRNGRTGQKRGEARDSLGNRVAKAIEGK